MVKPRGYYLKAFTSIVLFCIRMEMKNENLNNKRFAKRNGTKRMSHTDCYESVTPPDGGWGWIVVLASFLVHVIVDGIMYSNGIFYFDFLKFFQSGKGETAWVMSLVPGFMLIIGKCVHTEVFYPFPFLLIMHTFVFTFAKRRRRGQGV